MNYVILDLEWNGSYSKKVQHYVNEIIEFGAVKISSEMEIVDTFSALIKPQIGKKLSSHIVSLTHISNDELFDSDNTFNNIVAKFEIFLGDSVLLTWGTSDILTLMDNYMYYTGKRNIPFLKSYCNLQEYCENQLNLHDSASQLGLQTCAEILDISSDEELHRAYNDAYLSYKCLKKLYKKSEFSNFIYKADQEFYNKITFKNKMITDINNPLIDKSQLFFNCDECNIRAEQITFFKVKNKNFVAKFRCPKCRKQFTGRISIRLKFDGVVIKKKMLTEKVKELDNDDN